ncbi:hypothetical protein C0995_002145 [Termitomyces sp. Mi166|nr:hypothetical protein C0995_002145 [Termitomyces sp. Mi166\
MPLPEATLSLGPLLTAGGTEPVKPKVAMLVRLSSATIDALTSVMNEKEKVSVDLGSVPGIHIDGTFYPMRMQKEETPHEIYLRVPRSNNSLKLYANVAEKLFIEHNEIGDDLKDKIRERTLEAAKQRDVRKTKFIDTPLIQPAKVPKKKKEPPSTLRSANRLPDQIKLNVSTSSARAPSPAPQLSTKVSSTSASLTSGLFNRLIRCMATRERSRDAIVKLVSGDDPSIRRHILELMEEIGEPKSPLKKGEDAGGKIWCLKAKSWLHVRPTDWPGLTSQERLQLSRTGRMRLSSLGYSAKDPEWSPFAYRSTDTSVAPEKPAANDTRQREKSDLQGKSGISSSEVKKPKPKSDPNAEIPMKDESRKAAPRVSSTTTKTKEVASSISTTKKGPGSGFRAGKPVAQDSSGVAEGSSHGSEKDTKPPRHSLPSKTLAALPITQKEKTTAQRIKMRESDTGAGSESERDRDVRPKPAVKHEERRGAEVPILKRRQGPRDSYDSDASTSIPAPQKKRKTENGAAVSSSSKDVHSRDISLPKKSNIPRQKPRKEPTPPPSVTPLPKINKKANSSSRVNTPGNANKISILESTSSAHSPHEHRGRSEGKVSGKRRRGSPIYTSSEDEDECNTSKIRRIIKAPSPATETNPHKASHFRRREHEREPRPLPTDHASLRMRYTATYGQCMAALTTLLAQKSRIDSMLRNADKGSVTDSDGDGELMDMEDLKKLSGDYERMHEELETIRQQFAEPAQ